MEKNVLAILLKNPQLGKVKTRIAQTLGDEKALEIYHYLLNYTLDLAEEVNAEINLFCSDFLEDFGNDHWKITTQTGENLGEKLRNAFARCFAQMASKVIVIGSDCPFIQNKHIQQTYQALNNYDVVIGPASDGGYYLIAIKALHGEIFNDIDWSTDKVLAQTTAKIQSLNLSYFLLETLSDVDTENDWNNYLNIVTHKNISL